MGVGQRMGGTYSPAWVVSVLGGAWMQVHMCEFLFYREFHKLCQGLLIRQHIGGEIIVQHVELGGTARSWLTMWCE